MDYDDVVDENGAARFAAEWIESWNSHDLDAIMAHYHPEVVFSSPFVVLIGADPSGTVRGRDALRGYFGAGLERRPDLRFELIDVLAGAGGLTVRYRNERGFEAAETMILVGGLVVQGIAHYRSGSPR